MSMLKIFPPIRSVTTAATQAAAGVIVLRDTGSSVLLFL